MVENTSDPNLTVLIGTRAQLIKMAPVMLELESRGRRFNLVLSGQHEETMSALLADFGVATAPRWVYEGPEVTGVVQMGVWLVRCVFRCLHDRRELFPGARRSGHTFVVHGDTFSTLLGALVGKLLGATVVHVESGLRSFSLFHPFPEELTRLAVFHLADVACCPGQWASDNLARYRLRRVDTVHNTIHDAVDHALGSDRATDAVVPDSPYGVVSIHRFENIFNRARLARIVELVEIAARRIELVLVAHPSTAKQLQRRGLRRRLDDNPRIEIRPRMTYVPFVRLVAGAEFVITDGGSNQEELAYLGVPTLLMRKATERQEGLGETALLCPYDRAVLEAFVASPARFRHRRETTPAGPPPSRIIVDCLLEL